MIPFRATWKDDEREPTVLVVAILLSDISREPIVVFIDSDGCLDSCTLHHNFTNCKWPDDSQVA